MKDFGIISWTFSNVLHWVSTSIVFYYRFEFEMKNFIEHNTDIHK